MHKYLKTKYYFINNFDTNSINLQDTSTVIIYRNYSKKKIDELLILRLKKYCNKLNKKFYLSNNIKLAIKLDLDGVYIPSFNKSFSHLCYSYKKRFKIVGSAHNFKEIKIKELQKVQNIFLSSLFKKNKNYLDFNKFNSLSKLTNKKIIALGGISNKNLKKINLLNCYGFAGISYFEQKKGP